MGSQPSTHFSRLKAKTQFISNRAFHTNRVFREHPKLPQICTDYIIFNHCVARATIPLMKQVVKQAKTIPNDPVCKPLIDYMLQHIEEEKDHDKWFARDLGALGISESEITQRMPSPNIAALIGSQYYWVNHHHPVAFLGYICSTEAYPPSEESVQELIDRSHLPEAGFDTLMLHAKLDQDHKHEIVEHLDNLPLTTWHEEIIQMSSLQTFRYLALITEDICRKAH